MAFFLRCLQPCTTLSVQKPPAQSVRPGSSSLGAEARKGAKFIGPSNLCSPLLSCFLRCRFRNPVAVCGCVLQYMWASHPLSNKMPVVPVSLPMSSNVVASVSLVRSTTAAARFDWREFDFPWAPVTGWWVEGNFCRALNDDRPSVRRLG